MEISSSLLRAVHGWKPATDECLYTPAPKQAQKRLKRPPTAQCRLSSTARLLFHHLQRLARKGVIEETTKASLGGWLNRCRRAVRYALVELEASGLIQTETIFGPLGLNAGLRITLAGQTPFDAAGFYAKAAKAPESSSAIPCMTSVDSYLLTLQRKALKNIRAKKAAQNRLAQYALLIE